MRTITASAAAVGLTAGTALVAIAARAPLSRSSPIDAASASAPVSALLLVVAGAGALVLAGLVLLAPARRRREDDEPEPEVARPELHWAVKLAVTLFPLAIAAAITVALLSGAKTAHSLPGLALGLRGPGRASSAPAGGTRTGFELPSWLPWTVLGLVAAVAIAGAVVLIVVARTEKRRAAETEDEPAASAVDAAMSALDSDSDPRRGVIAAYAAMQRTLAEHGLARARSEAPREFLSRVLVASRATEREAATLTGLFEEARFSTHPIPEQARGRARSALGSLRARLSAPDAR